MSNKELYNALEMPLSKSSKKRYLQERYLCGMQLSEKEKLALGHDETISELEGYKFKPDHCYRTISEKTYNTYCEDGYILGDPSIGDYKVIEKASGLIVQNGGVHWYLGGISANYNAVIIECPASKEYFSPTRDNGCDLAIDPNVRHMVSSTHNNPVPMEMIRIIKHPTLELKKETEEKFIILN